MQKLHTIVADKLFKIQLTDSSINRSLEALQQMKEFEAGGGVEVARNKAIMN